VSGASKVKQGKKAGVTKLPRMEMYAVLGLELSKQIIERLEKVEKFFFEKLQRVEDSLEILSCQKARELNPDKPTQPETPPESKAQ
jgi:hypothetical protein